jgi:hypothetical protein
MNKNFFVAVPYTPTLKIGRGIGALFTPKTNPDGSMTNGSFEEHRGQLEQRAQLVSEGLARIGVKTITLGKDELVELFYHTYNPGDPTGSAPLTETN